jgi:isoquinoline 1-oxidoreductase beta subunit
MTEQKKKGPSRRLLILGGLAVGGGAAIGFGMAPWSRLPEQRALAGKAGAHVLLGALRIGADDTLTVIYPHADMGVGNGTALAQQLAEELDADWAQIRIERAPAETAFANYPLGQAFLRGDNEIPGFLAGAGWQITRRIAESMNLQITGGSTAIRLTGMEGMRHAGACARHMLTHAAAKEWGVPVGEVKIEGGKLTHASGKSSGFGALAEKAMAFSPPDRLPFKARADYKLVGQSKPRLDIPAKVTGAAKYSADIRLDGMLHAAIKVSPVHGGTLASVDDAPAKAMKGVAQVVKLKDAVAVLADNTWRAREALATLDPQWTPGANANLSSETVLASMRKALDGELKRDYARGDAAKTLAAATPVERVYTAPYLAHAAMEPVGAVAHIKDGQLTIWGAFQDALGAKAHAVKASGLKADAVKIIHTEMGGSFGRRGDTLNFLDHVIALAQATDKPVNLLYSREEDMTQDYYRNPSVARMRAVLADGKPTAIAHDFSERHDPPEATAIIYDVANVEARYSEGGNPAPWGPWRSVDHSVHGFFIESFVDELAVEAKQDPYQFRRALLANKPHHLAVLDAAAKMAEWDRKREGSALGIAIVESFHTVVAEVAEVALDAEGLPRVLNVWVAADPGLVVNPNGFAQQMESGVIYGLSAALFDEITFAEGRVQQTNFHDYPVMKLADCPKIHVQTLEGIPRVGGAGEPGAPPIAAAVANALFALTGKRVRSMPINKAFLGEEQRA